MDSRRRLSFLGKTMSDKKTVEELAKDVHRAGVLEGGMQEGMTCKPSGPSSYLAWHYWVQKRAKTHEPKRCPKCRLWHLWVKKEKV